MTTHLAPETRRGPRAEATHTALVELAGELFSTQGYAQTSMRDIARVGPVSMGAIYLHVKNKAELLVEALHRKIEDDLERTDATRAGAHDVVERLTASARTFRERRGLRTLLVQAAAASQTDDDTRDRVRAAQQEHIDDWVARYEANRARNGLAPEVDVPTAVLYTWAVELGLGMLEAFGMAPADPEAWADIQRRMASSLLADRG